MKHNHLSIFILAAALTLALTACGQGQTPGQSAAPQPSAQQSAPASESSPASPAPEVSEDVGEEDAWKVEFEKSLLENYEVVPDHYEDLGDGIYQVYVEIDGEVIPYVTVDSATGEYHG